MSNLDALQALNARVWALKKRTDIVSFADTAELQAISTERSAIHGEARAAGFIRIFDGSYKLSLPATEPTPSGLQYIMPGCEKDRTRGPVQMDLF